MNFWQPTARIGKVLIPTQFQLSVISYQLSVLEFSLTVYCSLFTVHCFREI